jgi:ubiquinone/menaquinone biosynthesis C-methylase UbiE
MEFGDGMIPTLESLYQAPEAANRRKSVLDALKLKRGECVLDIGTGPGFVALEMAEAVGALGQVECVDTSDAMIVAGLKRCATKPWVCFQIGHATELPVRDNSCDAAASVQVYEFVPDISKALEELRRVLRKGGRAAIVSTDWPSLVWHSSNPERMTRVLAAFGAHCAHLALPRVLPSMLKSAGFSIPEQRVLPHFDVSGKPDTFGYQMAGIIASFVPGHGGVTKAEAEEWLADLHEVSERGDWFFNVNQYLFLAQKQA